MSEKKKNNLHSKDKLLRVFGKKPRASKTSRRMYYKGFDFFIHRSTADTGGNIMLYWDKPPYPYISLIQYKKDEVDELTVQKWIDLNIEKMIDMFQRLDEFIHIPKDVFKKIDSKNEVKYEILEKIEAEQTKLGYRLVIHKHEDDYVYLWCNPNEAPSRNVKGKSVLDEKAIYQEYLKRKRNNE